MSDFQAEITVIGGGVIGSSVAYHLAKDKRDVLLVERSDIASGTSGACDGYVILQSKSPGIHLQMALESVKIFKSLSSELGYEVDYRNRGGHMVIETQEQLEIMKKISSKQRADGLDVELLDPEETRKREPVLAKHIAGSTYSPMDGQVHPMKLALGFIAGAKRLGARVLLETVVTGIRMKQGRVHEVITDKGTIRTDTVVCAAGVYSPQIGRMVGLDIPIKPRRGQIIVSEPVPRMVNGVMLCARYLAIKYNPEMAAKSDDPGLRIGVGFGLEQTEEGNILISNTREFVGYDSRNTLEGIKYILKYVLRLAPALRGICAIRSFAGLRPYTPDGLPILGPVPGVPGFIMAAGHEGDGIALSPITGKLIAEYLRFGEASIPLHHFKLERFSKVA